MRLAPSYLMSLRSGLLSVESSCCGDFGEGIFGDIMESGTGLFHWTGNVESILLGVYIIPLSWEHEIAMLWRYGWEGTTCEDFVRM